MDSKSEISERQIRKYVAFCEDIEYLASRIASLTEIPIRRNNMNENIPSKGKVTLEVDEYNRLHAIELAVKRMGKLKIRHSQDCCCSDGCCIAELEELVKDETK